MNIMRKAYVAPSFTSEEIIPSKGIMCRSGCNHDSGCDDYNDWLWWLLGWMTPVNKDNIYYYDNSKKGKGGKNDWWRW